MKATTATVILEPAAGFLRISPAAARPPSSAP